MKKQVSVLLCLALMFTAVFSVAKPAPVSAATTTMSTADIVKVMNHMLKDTTLDERITQFADFNGDSYINTSDARQMLLAILQENATFELPTNPIRLSSISDKTDSTYTRSYFVTAPYKDTYTISASGTSSLELKLFSKTIMTGTTGMTVTLNKGVTYQLIVKTSSANKSFTLTTTPKNNTITLPYETVAADMSGVSTGTVTNVAVNTSPIDYQKREGGTYIYCNNPEKIPYNAIGKAFMRDEGLTGDVFMTFEHSNYSGYSFYLGYQIKNEGSSDVLVTVTNVGYQTSGSWYGQKAWYDFYNMSFDLPDDFYTSSGAVNSAYTDYLYEDYTPRQFQPITYRLPAGKAMYVIGGTTADAYNNINVGGTANQRVGTSTCANGAVKFSVTGGSVTGTFYCYTSTSQVAANPSEYGYRTDSNYYLQYLGAADHHGVIDNTLTWKFNDDIGSGMLPVSYQSYYDSNASSVTTPYAAFNSTAHSYNKAYSWITNLNPQMTTNAVGTDMVEFSCLDHSSGQNVVIDNDHADGGGKPANTGNWMIEYQEQLNFVNQGKRDRTVILHLQDHGSLLVSLRDSKTGEVLDARLTIGQAVGDSYTKSLTVPANSIVQVSLCYVLMPNSAGSVMHSVSING